jgi:hypothetical protein
MIAPAQSADGIIRAQSAAFRVARPDSRGLFRRCAGFLRRFARPRRAINGFWSPNTARRWALEHRVWRRADLTDRQAGNKIDATRRSGRSRVGLLSDGGRRWQGPSAGFASRQNQSKKHKKNYLLPRSYLVKENLTGCIGWFDRIQHVLHPVFLLFFHPRKGYKLPAFAREVLWLSEQRNGVRGLLAKSVT